MKKVYKTMTVKELINTLLSNIQHNGVTPDTPVYLELDNDYHIGTIDKKSFYAEMTGSEAMYIRRSGTTDTMDYKQYA